MIETAPVISVSFEYKTRRFFGRWVRSVNFYSSIPQAQMAILHMEIANELRVEFRNFKLEIL